MPQIHSSQIQGVGGFQTLFDQLKRMDPSTQDVDIEYLMNDKGEVEEEIMWDMSSPLTPMELKRIKYSYDEQGSIVKETILVGSEKYEKEFIYADGVITRERVRKVTV
ncbi:hypothetical protein ACPA0F_18150 [Solibacillus silvestris]